MREKAYLTPELLKWARITAKMKSSEVAHKLKLSPEKFDSWESGEEYPTIKQAEKLSKLYRRPLAVFYLPEPPKDFQTLRDFRRKENQEEYSTALTFLYETFSRNKFGWKNSY